MLSINSTQLVFGEKTKSSKKRKAGTQRQGFWFNSTTSQQLSDTDKVVLSKQTSGKKKTRSWQKMPKEIVAKQSRKVRELGKRMPMLEAFGLLKGRHY